MKDYLVTDFFQINKFTNLFPKKYFELPVYDKKIHFDKNILVFSKWKDYKKKIQDSENNVKIYNYFLNQLIIFLNNYHNKNYSRRYWQLILTPWLYFFISSISFKWDLLKSLRGKKYIFLKSKIFNNETIPMGVEDFLRISTTDYWNHHMFTKIIESNFLDKIEIRENNKLIQNEERDKIYKKLKHETLKEKLSLFIQTFCNFIPQSKKHLIFSTYMTNFEEIKLNFKINKSLLYYKMLRPNYLFKKNLPLKFNRNKDLKLSSNGDPLSDFLSHEILQNIPSSYLENFDRIENILNNVPFPKSPKKIFTCLGFNRNILTDRYIARNIENGTRFILAQHGGNYFQHKFHFHTNYEVDISDIYLSWGKISKKNVIPFGIIKNLKKNKDNYDKSKKIILEVRMRKAYNREIKLDSGFIESKKYLKNLCDFFYSIKKKNFSKNLYVKLHPTKSFWNEKKMFLSYNKDLKFLDEKKEMIKEMNSAKLIIHTFCATGHLECISIDKPTLILFVHDLNLLNDKTKKYFIIFKKLGIMHFSSESLIKKLQKIDSEENLFNWWNDKNLQNILNKYRNDYCFINKERNYSLTKIINEK